MSSSRTKASCPISASIDNSAVDALPDTGENSWTRVAAARPRQWPPTALVIGDAARAEFSEAVAQIRACTRATWISDADAALAFDAEPLVVESLDPDPPDLIILLSARPGDLALAVIERWRHAAPLARVIGLLGSWCEGEARSGAPPPAVPRIYWHQWPAWFAREVALLSRGGCGTLSLPLTATDEERFLQAGVMADETDGAIVASNADAGTSGVIGVYSHRPETAALVAAVCRSLGYEAVDLRQSDRQAKVQLTAAVWDQTTPDATSFDELRVLVAFSREEAKGTRPSAQNPDRTSRRDERLAPPLAPQQQGGGTELCPPWIALMNFPRREDRERALACGAREVLAKPLAIDDLRQAIERLILVGLKGV